MYYRGLSKACVDQKTHEMKRQFLIGGLIIVSYWRLVFLTLSYIKG